MKKRTRGYVIVPLLLWSGAVSRIRKIGKAIVLSTLTLAAACSDTPNPTSHPGEPVTQKQEAFSSFGIERVIPLRIVMMANDCNAPQTDWGPGSCGWVPANQSVCTPCTNGANDCGPDVGEPINIGTPGIHDEIVGSLEQANSALKTLGVQFYVSRIEKYKMPTFWNKAANRSADNPPNYYWYEIWPQFQGPYPNMSSYLFDPWDEEWEHHWLQAVQLRAGDPREIIIWLAECAGYGFDGARPWQAGASLVADRRMFQDARFLAHELGHIVGLEHTMYPAQARNPELPNDLDFDKEYNYWDLYYGITAAGYHFFDSAAAAYNFSLSHTLWPKHSWDPDGLNQNCHLDANCSVTCCMGGLWNESAHACSWGTAMTVGDPGIRGIGFTFAGDNPILGVFRRGVNGMAYLDPLHNQACPWVSFSESQAQQVKRMLRSDIRVDNGDVFAEYSLQYRAKRHMLGDYRNRSGMDQLDFDGDGRRDIAIWQPPGTEGAPTPGVGRFLVLTSSSNFSTTMWRDMGRAGDVPIPGYYDNDNVLDFAVLRRGGLGTPNPFDHQFWWVWCKSNANPQHDCTNVGVLDWGELYDVPIPNLEMDGNTQTKEIGVFRQKDNLFFWKSTDNHDWGNVVQVPAMTNTSHLHGLYDADWKTDLVFYDRDRARFLMLLSGSNWATQLWRYFPAALQPDPLGASGNPRAPFHCS